MSVLNTNFTNCKLQVSPCDEKDPEAPLPMDGIGAALLSALQKRQHAIQSGRSMVQILAVKGGVQCFTTSVVQ